ncbi:unnamed protein product [Lupinus luteus]|uniref:P-loop containing nucleoside triphosphate hydrolases superfamily protein n=1 Tax=Lupinus luteus TaxID=3873 RepID=A0AAV1W0N6_LUPLU
MGGDSIVYHDEEDSSLEEDFNFPLLSSHSLAVARDEDDRVNEENGSVSGQSSEENKPTSSKFDFEVIERNRLGVSQQILQSYEELKIHSKNLREEKEKILSYIPGAWTDKVRDYDIPTTTCLILVGPRGSGKSTLVNRITKALEDDKFAPARAQVSYNSPIGDENGTYFLQEYMIPRDSTSICLYDTRSLSYNSHENENDRTLKSWMTKGVRHGELIVRKTDDRRLRKSLKCKAHKKGFSPGKIRKVNFVIYVVNGLSVLKELENTDGSERQYTETIISTFNCPYLSFKDDKPVLVFTHGDLLSLSDRARVRAYLGELLGIPPTTQVFDIPDCDDLVTETSIVEMLRYSLEHADRNFPPKKVVIDKIHKASLSLCMILLILMLGVAIALSHNMSIYPFHALQHQAFMRKDHAKYPKEKIHKMHHKLDWHKIRHIW